MKLMNQANAWSSLPKGAPSPPPYGNFKSSLLLPKPVKLIHPVIVGTEIKLPFSIIALEGPCTSHLLYLLS